MSPNPSPKKKKKNSVLAALDGLLMPDAPLETACETAPGISVAIHQGQCFVSEDPYTKRTTYTGPVVITATRLGTAAHGGQILCSQAAWTVVEAALERLSVEWTPLGSWKLGTGFVAGKGKGMGVIFGGVIFWSVAVRYCP
jgi:class 3 adenylate cyclase